MGAREYWDTLVPGLAIRVGSTGKTWTIRYRANEQQRRFKLGTYPKLSLADARARARAKLAEVEGGADPAQERESQRRKAITFADLAAEVLQAKRATTRESTRRNRQRIVDAELLPIWGKRPAASITRRDVVHLVECIAARAPSQANQTLACINVIFNSGLERDFPTLEANPAHLMKPLPTGGRDRFLERDEIRIVWEATAEETPVIRAVFRLALLTAQRIGSVCALRWDSIDQADIWRIPAPSFKGKRDHLVPLSSEALAVLAEISPISGGVEYAFPGRSDSSRSHITNTTNALDRIRKRTQIPSWVAHDFRASFRTHATRARDPEDSRDPAGLGVEPHVADLVLGHAERSLGYRAYTGNRERYMLSEKRQALKAWGAFVLEAVG